MSSKPRIVVAFEYPSVNGGENSILAVMDKLIDRAEWLALAPVAGPLNDRLAALNVPNLGMPSFSGPSRLDDARKHIAKVLEECRPNVVHANSLAMSRILGPVAKRLGYPSLGHLRDIIRLSRQAVLDVSCVDQLIAVSSAVRDFHVRQGLPESSIAVVHNGVDLDQFRPRKKTNYLNLELGLSHRAFFIGGIGQIGPRKGWDCLFEALPSVFTRYPDAHLLLAGERSSVKQESVDYEKALHQRAGHQPLLGRVHFLGRRDDIPKLLNELSMLVHPARQEPLGRVLLEAAASGVPIVATDVGGTCEIFPPGTESAEIIASNRPEAVEAAICGLFDNDSKMKRLSDNGRRHIESRFEISRCANATWRHYLSLAPSQHCQE